MTMTLIEHKELTGSQASIEFTNIPNSYTDLCLVLSLRTARAAIGTTVTVQPNSATTGLSYRYLRGNGSGTASGTDSYILVPAANATSNTFGNAVVYIPNYTSSNAKSMSADSVTENNATEAYQGIQAALWTGTAVISSLKIVPNETGDFVQYSSATLYGILKGSDGTTTVS